jgi:hypothetical protein
MTETTPPQSRYSETYAQRVAKAVIDDWRSRPRLRRSGDPFIKTLMLDAHLSRDAEEELRGLLFKAGLEFDTNQILVNGKIERQTNIIHIQRVHPDG